MTSDIHNWEKIYLFACKEDILRGYYRDELIKWKSGRLELCRATIIGQREIEMNTDKYFEENMSSPIKYWCLYFQCKEAYEKSKPLNPYGYSDAAKPPIRRNGNRPSGGRKPQVLVNAAEPLVRCGVSHQSRQT